jgi:hypothetical protein
LIKFIPGFRRYEPDTKYILQIFNDLDIEPARLEHGFCTSSWWAKHFTKVSWYSFQGFKRYEPDTKYMVQIFKHPWWPGQVGTLVRCTSSSWAEHLTKVSWNSLKGFKRYEPDTKYMVQIFKHHWWHWPWTDNVGTWVLHIVLMGRTFD